MPICSFLSLKNADHVQLLGIAAWCPTWVLGMAALWSIITRLPYMTWLLAGAMFCAACFITWNVHDWLLAQPRQNVLSSRFAAIACCERVVHYAYVALVGLPALLVTDVWPDAVTTINTMPHAAFLTAYAILVYCKLSFLDARTFWASVSCPPHNNNNSVHTPNELRTSLVMTLEKAAHHALTLSVLLASVHAGMMNMGSSIYVLYTMTSLPLYIRTMVRSCGWMSTPALDAVFTLGWISVRMPLTLRWTHAVYSAYGNGGDFRAWSAHALFILNIMNLFWTVKLCHTAFITYCIPRRSSS